MKNLFARFAKDESGATAIEYGLIAALIAVVCIGTWRAIGTGLLAMFGDVQAGLNYDTGTISPIPRRPGQLRGVFYMKHPYSKWCASRQ